MGRALQTLVLLVLLAAGVTVYWSVYAFFLTRFFTVDEYQLGHATWLVAQGQVPYVDFFWHLFPLGHALHAPFFVSVTDFAASALLLRKIIFVYWLVLGVLAGVACWGVTRDRLAAASVAFLPLCCGFGLMSAADYRPDNFGAVYLGACLVLLEWNRIRRSRAVAALCGVAAVLAAGTTQKMTFYAGVILAVLWLADELARRRRWDHRPFLARPGVLFGSAAAVGVALVGVAAALGMLEPGIESTLVEAWEHERTYARASVFEKGYVTRFWSETWPGTSAILLFAAGFLATRPGRFWLVPVATSLLATSLIAAPYPYNFVFPCWVVTLAAVRGFALCVTAAAARLPSLEPAAPVLYLLPLALLASQLGFVTGTTTNAHQLRLLSKIQRYGAPGDAVIDSAGGAMFSPHASYYFYHGAAHRELLADYFSTGLIDDFRRSRALFWILDSRYNGLPQSAKDYLQSHYVHGGDGLHVLGIRTPAKPATRRQLVFDVVRAGEYRVHPRGRDPGAPDPAHRLSFDGERLAGDRIRLDVGPHVIDVPAGAPAYLVAPVDASFFEPTKSRAHYSKLFEYRTRAVPEERATRGSRAPGASPRAPGR